MATEIKMIALIVLLAFGAIVVSLIVAAIRSRSGVARALLIVLGVCVVFVVLMLFGYRSARSVRTEQMEQAKIEYRPGDSNVYVSDMHNTTVIGPPNLIPLGQNEWTQSFDTDPQVSREPHTSMKTFTRYLAARIEAKAQDVMSVPGSPVRIFAPDDSAAPLVNAMRPYLSLGLVNVKTARPETRPSEETWVEVRWENKSERSASWWPTPLQGGKAVATITGPKGTAKAVATLDEKPWLETPPSTVGRSDYLVFTSGQPVASKELAVESLRRQAIEQMTGMIVARGAALPSGAPSLADARAQATSLFWGIPYVDRAVVGLDRPYGRVWFAADLYHVSPDEFTHRAMAARSVVVERHRTWAGMMFGVGGMVLVLALLYAALNALTRGYFRGHLRAAVVVVAAVAIAAVLLMMT
jgi:hypothetical protein